MVVFTRQSEAPSSFNSNVVLSSPHQLHLPPYLHCSPLGFTTPTRSILPPVDRGPTPAVEQTFPGNGGIDNGRQSFVFSPPSQPSDTSLPSLSSTCNLHLDKNSTEDGEKDDERDERSTLHLSALDFMTSLSEARPNMVRKVRGWIQIIVRACLEGIEEFDEEETKISGLEILLREDVSIFFLFVFLRLNCGLLYVLL